MVGTRKTRQKIIVLNGVPRQRKSLSVTNLHKLSFKQMCGGRTITQCTSRPKTSSEAGSYNSLILRQPSEIVMIEVRLGPKNLD
jgi:hypothetical protein